MTPSTTHLTDDNTKILRGRPALISPGLWGVLIKGDPASIRVSPGDIVHVKARNGKTWRTTVTRRVQTISPWGVLCEVSK